MSMNIYAKNGDKVVFSNPNNGYDGDRADGRKYLTVGKAYTVDHTEVDSSHTNVWLKEIPSVWFNSVLFSDAPAQGTPEPPKVEEILITDARLEQIKQIRAYGLQAEPTALLLAIDDLLQALRPYFPQTPQISADEIRHLVDCVHIGCNGSVTAHEGFGHPACIACKVALKLAATPASTAQTDGKPDKEILEAIAEDGLLVTWDKDFKFNFSQVVRLMAEFVIEHPWTDKP